MKKLHIVGKSAVVLSLAMLLLTGCFGKNPPPQETVNPTEVPPQVQPTATPEAAETPQPTEVPKIEIADTLDRLTGWGKGTAGSSLSSVSAAYDLLVWCDENQAQSLAPESIQRGIADWLNAQPEEMCQDLIENWNTVADLADDLLSKDPYATGILEDLEKQPLTSETLQDNWNAFRKAADVAFDMKY